MEFADKRRAVHVLNGIAHWRDPLMRAKVDGKTASLGQLYSHVEEETSINPRLINDEWKLLQPEIIQQHVKKVLHAIQRLLDEYAATKGIALPGPFEPSDLPLVYLENDSIDLKAEINLQLSLLQDLCKWLQISVKAHNGDEAFVKETRRRLVELRILLQIVDEDDTERFEQFHLAQLFDTFEKRVKYEQRFDVEEVDAFVERCVTNKTENPLLNLLEDNARVYTRAEHVRGLLKLAPDVIHSLIDIGVKDVFINAVSTSASTLSEDELRKLVTVDVHADYNAVKVRENLWTALTKKTDKKYERKEHDDWKEFAMLLLMGLKLVVTTLRQRIGLWDSKMVMHLPKQITAAANSIACVETLLELFSTHPTQVSKVIYFVVASGIAHLPDVIAHLEAVIGKSAEEEKEKVTVAVEKEQAEEDGAKDTVVEEEGKDAEEVEDDKTVIAEGVNALKEAAVFARKATATTLLKEIYSSKNLYKETAKGLDADGKRQLKEAMIRSLCFEENVDIVLTRLEAFHVDESSWGEVTTFETWLTNDIASVDEELAKKVEKYAEEKKKKIEEEKQRWKREQEEKREAERERRKKEQEERREQEEKRRSEKERREREREERREAEKERRKKEEEEKKREGENKREAEKERKQKELEERKNEDHKEAAEEEVNKEGKGNRKEGEKENLMLKAAADSVHAACPTTQLKELLNIPKAKEEQSSPEAVEKAVIPGVGSDWAPTEALANAPKTENAKAQLEPEGGTNVKEAGVKSKYEKQQERRKEKYALKKQREREEREIQQSYNAPRPQPSQSSIVPPPPLPRQVPQDFRYRTSPQHQQQQGHPLLHHQHQQQNGGGGGHYQPMQHPPPPHQHHQQYPQYPHQRYQQQQNYCNEKYPHGGGYGRGGAVGGGIGYCHQHRMQQYHEQQRNERVPLPPSRYQEERERREQQHGGAYDKRRNVSYGGASTTAADGAVTASTPAIATAEKQQGVIAKEDSISCSTTTSDAVNAAGVAIASSATAEEEPNSSTMVRDDATDGGSSVHSQRTPVEPVLTEEQKAHGAKALAEVEAFLVQASTDVSVAVTLHEKLSEDHVKVMHGPTQLNILLNCAWKAVKPTHGMASDEVAEFYITAIAGLLSRTKFEEYKKFFRKLPGGPPRFVVNIASFDRILFQQAPRANNYRHVAFIALTEFDKWVECVCILSPSSERIESRMPKFVEEHFLPSAYSTFDRPGYIGYALPFAVRSHEIGCDACIDNCLRVMHLKPLLYGLVWAARTRRNKFGEQNKMDEKHKNLLVATLRRLCEPRPEETISRHIIDALPVITAALHEVDDRQLTVRVIDKLYERHCCEQGSKALELRKYLDHYIRMACDVSPTVIVEYKREKESKREARDANEEEQGGEYGADSAPSI